MLVPILAVLAAAFAGGFLWAYMGWQRTSGALAAAEARIDLVEESRVTMGELLKAQAAQSAQVVADQMVSRATETFRAQDQLAGRGPGGHLWRPDRLPAHLPQFLPQLRLGAMWRYHLRGLREDERGVASVEMALLAWPTIFMIIGALQFVIAQYTQVMLSSALYDSASTPEPELLLASADAYKTTLCGKIRVVQAQSCKAQIVVEMMRLSDVPTAATGITGATFSAGSANDALLLRAALPTLRILPLIPAITAKSSVVFRR